jgi:glycolate oxidase iron-sulfur subunit
VRLKAGLLIGCVQRLAFSEVNRATIDVLAAEGCSVEAPPAQGCCGALALHAGNIDQARDLARYNIAVFEKSSVERIVVNARVVYHDACHLAHAQGVRAQPRALLAAIPGVELLTPAEADLCCGSAGIYNLVQPEPAEQLGERKARNIAVLNPDIIATGNPGCILQIAAAGRRLGHDWKIVHPIELIARSIKG